MNTSPAEPITFTCGSCGFHARLAQHYQGKAIRCPGCEAPQLVGVVATAPATDARARAGSAPVAPGKVAFDCVSCGHHAEISSDYAGKVVWCPGCNAVRIVPRASTASAAPAAARSEPREAGFNCQACGFHSRAIPSGVNGVVYCLACRAPQPMVAGLDPAVLAPIDPTETSATRDDIDPRSHTPIGLVSPFSPAEHATLDAVSATVKAEEAATADPGDFADMDQFIEPMAPSTAPANGKASADKKVDPQTADTQKLVAKDAVKPPVRPRAPERAKAPKPESKHTTTVNVVQKGVRKVYRAADDKTADKPVEAKNAAPAAVPAAGGKSGLFGRLSSRFFKKKS
ncbi:MAG TPA: hypothetical protein VEL07_03860 [Planctomycetota bacterium]|nr:hypothetical protein [Planctomycetota bacterium]